MLHTSDSVAKPGYRADIDGLRAFAVIAVLFYHASSGILPAGFVGVDLFFVISGFLITRIISRDIQTGSFSFGEFYGRRFRRILPALLVVLATAWIAGRYFLFADEFRSLGKHLKAGALFATNFALLKEGGYFGGGSNEKPLLHLWSLAVEEQFYFVWPLLLWAILRGFRTTRTVSGMVLGIALVSFAANVYFLERYPDETFYFLPTRFWQLLAGAFLALRWPHRSSFEGGSRWHRDFTALLAPLLLLVAVFFTDRVDSYPGWAALLPTLAALLFIWNGPKSPFNRLLSNRYLVFVGRISYPLYLWHWPLLAIARMRVGAELSWQIRLGLMMLAAALATLTWKFIERPAQNLLFRCKGGVPPARAWIAWGLAGLAVVASVGLLTERGQLYTREQVAQLPLASYSTYRASWGDCFLGGPKQSFDEFPSSCVKSPPKFGKSVFVWGDSFSAALWPGVERYLGDRGVTVSHLAASLCPPLADLRLSYRPHCYDINQHVLGQIAALKPDVVVLSAKWFFYQLRPDFYAQLHTTVARLRQLGVRRILIAGNAPEWGVSIYRDLLRTFRDKGEIPHRLSKVGENIFARNKELGEWARREGVTFHDVLSTLCNQDGCLTVVGDNLATDLSTFDAGHLTDAASNYVVEKSMGRVLTKLVGGRRRFERSSVKITSIRGP